MVKRQAFLQGYRDLDQMTAGFNRNDLIILAARPSVGKTAFALNIAQKVATHEGNYTVGIFSLEMGADQLATRMICSSGNVDSNRLRTGTMTEEDWNRFTIQSVNYHVPRSSLMIHLVFELQTYVLNAVV